ncbi:MAG: ankyrin repeat domain-containing protein [Candidatus Hydrogenedentes bacterium]|nr:ankyrin repeat domain-containing protein [Candidatus Hydrogenedentota bacterium]
MDRRAGNLVFQACVRLSSVPPRLAALAGLLLALSVSGCRPQVPTPEIDYAPEEAGNTVRRTEDVAPAPALHALLDLFLRGVDHPLAPTRWRVAGLSYYPSIHQAVAAGDLYAVVDQIEGGANLHERDKDGRTPLLVAAAENQPFVADYLLDRGAQLSDRDSLGNSAMHLAARASHIYTLENLLHRGATLETRDLEGYTPLHRAAEAGDLFAVQHLVALGANLFAMQNDGELSIPAVLAARKRHWEVTRFFREKGQYFPIHMMAAQGDLPGVSEAISDMPAAVNLFDSMQNTPLMSAVQTGECETAALLLERGADPTLRNLEGEFPLAIALRRSHFACAETLLERGANINEPLSSGVELTLLGDAVRSAPIETVSFILEHGADPRASWEGGRTALHVAVEIADVAKVRRLVEAGADPAFLNVAGWSPLLLAAQRGLLPVLEAMTTDPDLLDAPSNDGRRPIHEAAARGQDGVVAWLLSRGVSPTSADGAGRTALHRAALEGHTTTATLLLEAGALLEAVDTKGNTPWLAAVEGGSTAMLQLLLARGANGGQRNTSQAGAVHIALANHHVPLVYWLHDHGVPIDPRDGEGRSALYPAVRTGDREVVEWLAALNLPVDDRDRAGLGPIHEATAGGDIETIRFLIEKGVSVANADANLNTPLHFAAARGNGSIIRLLLDSGAPLEVENADGQRPLHMAARNGHGDCVEVLAVRGAVVNAADHHGSTPLIAAAAAGHYDAVVALIRRGASIEMVNADGLTPLQAASYLLESPVDDTTREEIFRVRAFLHAVLAEEFRAVATAGDLERMKTLLIAYPSYRDAPTFGRTPVHWAAQSGHDAMVELLGSDLH